MSRVTPGEIVTIVLSEWRLQPTVWGLLPRRYAAALPPPAVVAQEACVWLVRRHTRAQIKLLQQALRISNSERVHELEHRFAQRLADDAALATRIEDIETRIDTLHERRMHWSLTRLAHYMAAHDGVPVTEAARLFGVRIAAGSERVS